MGTGVSHCQEAGYPRGYCVSHQRREPQYYRLWPDLYMMRGRAIRSVISGYALAATVVKESNGDIHCMW